MEVLDNVQYRKVHKAMCHWHNRTEEKKESFTIIFAPNYGSRFIEASSTISLDDRVLSTEPSFYFQIYQHYKLFWIQLKVEGNGVHKETLNYVLVGLVWT